MPIFSIPLPNGVIVDVEAPNDSRETEMRAQAHARQIFRQQFPDEFETWRQRQVGIGRSLTSGFSSGVDQAQALGYGAAEGLGELVNLPSLAAWGRQGRIRNEIEAEAAFPSELRTDILDVTGPGSLARAATELVTQSLPQTAVALGGAAAGAALAPSAPVLAGIGGAALTQYPLFFGGDIARQTQVEAEQRGVPAQEGRVTSPGAAALAAIPQSLVGAVTDVITGRAAGLFGGAAGKAGAPLGKRIAGAGATGAVSNAIGEPIEQGLERLQAGLPLTGAEAGREYLEASLGGAVAGGITGGALGGMFGQRPAPPPAADLGAPAGFQPPTPPADQPPPRFQPLTLPERPTPFASMEEAEAFAAANPNLAPPVSMATPEASANWVFARREEEWQRKVDELRQQAINEFVAAPKPNEAAPNPQAQASELLTNLAEAQGRGDINLNRFSPNGVAKVALSLRDIDPGKPTKSELDSISAQLDALVDLGYLKKNTVQEAAKPKSGKGKATKRTSTFYSISTEPVVQPTQQTAPATEQAAAPAPQENIPNPAYGEWERQWYDAGINVLSQDEQVALARGQLEAGYKSDPAYQAAEQKFEAARGAWAAQNPPPPQNIPQAPAAPEAQAPAPKAPAAPTASPPSQATDPVYQAAVDAVEQDGIGTTRSLQQRLGVGYNQAARLIERLEQEGVLSPANNVGQRKFLGRPQTQPATAVPPPTTSQAATPSPATPVAPAPEVPPATASQLWQAYALNAGPHTGNPIVRDARNAARVRGRSFTKDEFTNFANQYGAAPTPEAKAEVAATFASPAAPQPAPQAAATPAPEAAPAPESAPVQPSEDPVAGPEVTDTVKDRPRIEKQFEDSMNPILRWFASPIMTAGNVKPIFRAASDALKQIYTRRQEATTEFGPLLEPLASLPAESRAKVTLAMQEARSRGIKPDPAAFSQAEYAAMESAWKAGQRALDFMIDAYVKTYFDPQNATDPQVRTKLEAFQRAKGSKLITDMPAEEVRAASEAGYQEMQRYNRVRDPLFFPQVATGSHFVAAYAKQPGGKENLVRIYFYDPLNKVQKFRGIRDPEQRALEFLRQEFPNTQTHRIMTRGVPSEQDQSGRAQKVRKDGDFIAHFLQELSKVSNKEGRQVIDRMFKEINKSQMERIFRKNNDVLRAVTPDNAAEYAIDMMPSYFLSLATIQARQYVQDDFARATQPLTPNDRKYWEELRDYATMPGEAYGTARALAFFTFLGFAVDTAAINLTQGPFVTAPRLMRDGGSLASRYYLSALKSTLGNFDVGKLLKKDLAYTNSVIERLKITNPGEVAALELARRQGVFTPLYTNESRGQVSVDTLRRAGFGNPARVANGINTMADWGGRLMQAVEEFNRVSSFLAAYRMARANPSVIDNANRLDNKQMKTPYDYASSVVFDTQFITAKEDRALIQRFRPEAEVATQFMSFPLKMIEQYARHGSMMIRGIAKADPFLAKAGALAFFGMLAPLIGVAGIWALPFADSLREIVERLAKAVWGDPINFKMEVEKLLQGQTIGGQRLAGVLNNGFTHEAGIMSLQRRLAIDPLPAQDLLGSSTLALFGPVGGLIEKPFQAFDYIKNGDAWGVASTLLPRAVGNVVKGAQLATEGEMRTIRNTTVIAPSVVDRADAESLVPSSVRQAMGFPPPAFMDERETVARRLELNTQMNKAKERVHAELAQIMVGGMRASQRGDTAKANEAQAKFRQRILEIVQEDETRPLAERINPQMSAIRDRAIQDFYGRGSPEANALATNSRARAQMFEEQRMLGRMPPQ